jgi:GNAT superfamily N-acetyltransferase
MNSSPIARFEVRAEPVGDLRVHAAIGNAFETSVVYDVISTGGRHELRERRLGAPLRKDYDALENPLSWPRQFDVSRWTLLAAFMGARRVGGAIAAFDTPGVDMLEGRNDLLVLWDLRVAPDARRLGIASLLFSAAEDWGRARGCGELKVETQDVNVAACNLYLRQGCTLMEATTGAYAGLPAETRLIWRKRITG